MRTGGGYTLQVYPLADPGVPFLLGGNGHLHHGNLTAGTYPKVMEVLVRLIDDFPDFKVYKWFLSEPAVNLPGCTLQGNIPKNGILKMIFLFPRWDMLIPWRVIYCRSWNFTDSTIVKSSILNGPAFWRGFLGKFLRIFGQSKKKYLHFPIQIASISQPFWWMVVLV